MAPGGETAGASATTPALDSRTLATVSRKPMGQPTIFRSRPPRAEGHSRKFKYRGRSVRPEIVEEMVGRPPALIVDDEFPARLRLRELLERSQPVVLCGECESGAD